MKTIFRIIVILLVTTVIAGAFSLAVNNGSLTSASNDGRQLPSITSADGRSFQPMTHTEGDDHDGGGMGGVFGTLAKITGITIFVLAIQKAFGLIGNRRLISAQR